MFEKRIPWFWVLAAFVVASTRANENGISLDPALFSAIARNFSRDGIWWSQHASPELFPQYFEHPFLPLWLQGILFKLFGANDTTSRYLGLILGPASFYFLYRIGERLGGKRFSSVFCFVCLVSAHFIGRMGTFYTEISLTFFLLGSFSFFLNALEERPVWWSLWSGLFLGLAAWCKGLAVAPMAATLAAVALYQQRLGVFRSPVLWITAAVSLLFSASFCGLQGAFGSYPYCSLYFDGALNKKVMGPEFMDSAPAFFKVFFSTHSLYCLLALAGIVEAVRNRAPRKAVIVGCLASALFLAAGSTLKRTHFHYYYPIYPMVNLVAAGFIYGFAVRRGWALRWHRGALGFALVYVLLWQVLPLHMRRPIASDWVQLSGVMREVKAKGVERLDAVGISAIDWVYREMSLWYWDVDSKMEVPESQADGKVVIASASLEEPRKVLLSRGYFPCASSPLYDVYVKEADWQELCRRAPLDPGLVR